MLDTTIDHAASKVYPAFDIVFFIDSNDLYADSHSPCLYYEPRPVTNTYK